MVVDVDTVCLKGKNQAEKNNKTSSTTATTTTTTAAAHTQKIGAWVNCLHVRVCVHFMRCRVDSRFSLVPFRKTWGFSDGGLSDAYTHITHTHIAHKHYYIRYAYFILYVWSWLRLSVYRLRVNGLYSAWRKEKRIKRVCVYIKYMYYTHAPMLVRPHAPAIAHAHPYKCAHTTTLGRFYHATTTTYKPLPRTRQHFVNNLV